MNILEAFTKLDDENYKVTVKFENMKFIKIYGDLYRSLDNYPYRHIENTQDAFSYEEIMSTDWEIIEKED